MTSLNQDKVWRGEPLEDLSLSHQVNLLAFLRRKAKKFQALADYEFCLSALACVEDPSDGVAAAMMECEAEFRRPAEEWIEDQPLIRRLVELTSGVSKVQRARIKVTNKAYEALTGYRPL